MAGTAAAGRDSDALSGVGIGVGTNRFPPIRLPGVGGCQPRGNCSFPNAGGHSCNQEGFCSQRSFYRQTTTMVEQRQSVVRPESTGTLCRVNQTGWYHLLLDGQGMG